MTTRQQSVSEFEPAPGTLSRPSSFMTISKKNVRRFSSLLPAGSWSWSFKTIPGQSRISFLQACSSYHAVDWKGFRTLATWHLFVWCDRDACRQPWKIYHLSLTLAQEDWKVKMFDFTWVTKPVKHTADLKQRKQKRPDKTGKENNILQHKEKPVRFLHRSSNPNFRFIRIFNICCRLV